MTDVTGSKLTARGTQDQITWACHTFCVYITQALEGGPMCLDSLRFSRGPLKCWLKISALAQWNSLTGMRETEWSERANQADRSWESISKWKNKVQAEEKVPRTRNGVKPVNLHDLTKSKQAPSTVVKWLERGRKQIKFVQDLYNSFMYQVLALPFSTKLPHTCTNIQILQQF